MGPEDHLPDRVRVGEERLLNPAQGLRDAGTSLAALMEGLPVVVEESPLPLAEPPIAAAEAALVANAVGRRRIEFATGRWCARRALERLGVGPTVVGSDSDRAPRWPAGVVGSITHTGIAPGGFCGVAVARAAQIRALGVDAETAGPLDETLWPHVLTEKERDEVAGRVDGGLVAKVIFSAKECFYKAQFPLSRRFLDFQDVEVSFDLSGPRFVVHVSPAFQALPLQSCSGRHALREDGLVLTAIAVPA